MRDNKAKVVKYKNAEIKSLLRCQLDNIDKNYKGTGGEQFRDPL